MVLINWLLPGYRHHTSQVINDTCIDVSVDWTLCVYLHFLSLRFINPECPTINLTMRAKPAFLPFALLQGKLLLYQHLPEICWLKKSKHFREELAIIENRILEKQLLAKKKAEKRAKNIAVFSSFPISLTKPFIFKIDIIKTKRNFP